MKINSYSFGKIIIDDMIYNSDIIIFPDHIQQNWRRKKGHLLQVEDLEAILKIDSNTIIVGTGAYGLMKIHQEVLEEFKNRNINFVANKTGKAVEMYNKMYSHNNVSACLHLTC
ncbi:MAG: MTH938/NDUFAF3 family protein [Candidatus Cloacimonetes bacterium]|nr:MTH938/NDUFAF3 family protein [Candidatus Cloacimonadota bacterium]